MPRGGDPGHCAHDQVLNLWPVIDHLSVTHPDDVVPAQHELRIVSDVPTALSPDMMTAVDLQHESVADEGGQHVLDRVGEAAGRPAP